MEKNEQKKEFRLTPAYCIYNKIAVLEQKGSHISFLVEKIEDLSLQNRIKKAFIEIKGCTLEIDGVVKFPDAKTERGVKHVRELIKAREDGYLAYIIIVIQMEDVLYFTPNIEMHKEFGDVLKEADAKGVNILAYDSIVKIDDIKLNKPVKVIL